VVSFVSGPAFTSLLSADRKGSTYTGLLHSSDWYKTLVEGVAGGTVPTAPGSTGAPPPDEPHYPACSWRRTARIVQLIDFTYLLL
jgi:hypothetical protein